MVGWYLNQFDPGPFLNKGKTKMKLLLIYSILFIASCADKTMVASVTAKDGVNGHSVVSLVQTASSIECTSSGSRMDMYIDNDDSLSTSQGDTYINSLVVCNGTNGLNGQQGSVGMQGPQGLAGEVGPQGPTGATGLQGPVGPQGPQGPQGQTGPAGSSATITAYNNSSSCINLTGSSYYVKNGDIYSGSTCASNTKVAVLQGSGTSYWISSNILAVDGGNSTIRVIKFN